jgi:phosphate transport system substrate-binding protein
MRNFLFLLFFIFFVSSGGILNADSIINGAGATFPYPVYQTWAYSYYKEKGVKINYQSIGSGGGIQQIKSRTVDFGATDDPLRADDLGKDNLLQFPAIMGGIVPVINIEGVNIGALKLTGEVLADIFLGKIKKWNDKAILAFNSGIKLPDAEITVIHRSDGSGTTAIFSTYLSEVSNDWKVKVGAGKALNWPVGLGGKGNEGVANYVGRLKNSIGYVEFAYVMQNNMNYVTLKNKEGQFVQPNSESFAVAASKAKWEQNKHYYIWLINEPGATSWPIVGVSFILLAKDKLESNKKVVQFFNWVFQNGDNYAKSLNYVPLPASLKDDIRNYWKNNGL